MAGITDRRNLSPARRRRSCVGGHDDPLPGLGSIHHGLICRTLQADVADVAGVVACCAQQVGKDRRQVLVDEESHAVCRSGSSRSRTASAA
jgi:hypothetical protein